MAELSLAQSVPILYEPLLKNRWTVDFPTDIGIQTFQLMSVDLPTLTINKTEIDFMNTKTYVSGKGEWGEINMTLRDFVAPATSQAIMSWIRTDFESVTGRSGYASGYAKDLSVNVLDPTGVVVRKWLYRNCIPTSVNFGSLDYSDDNLLTIEFTVQPQDCILLF